MQVTRSGSRRLFLIGVAKGSLWKGVVWALVGAGRISFIYLRLEFIDSNNKNLLSFLGSIHSRIM